MDNKILTLLFTLCCFLPIKAEDIIQVVPLYVSSASEKSATTHEFQMNLKNTKPIWGVQLELKLPEGISLPKEAFEIIDERVPKLRIDTLHIDSLLIDSVQPDSIRIDTIVRDSIVIDTLDSDTIHQVEYNTVDGWTYVVVSPNHELCLEGNSGNILKIKFKMQEGMPGGIHPIEIRNVLLVFEDGSTKPYPSSSYICIGESPIKTQKEVDLSRLSNYLPSFVMDSINQDLAQNKEVLSLDLTGAERLGNVPAMLNPNALCYIDAASAAAIDFDRADFSNIVKVDGLDYSCSQLTLDEKFPFHSAHLTTVSKATLYSPTTTTGWNSICLPFHLTPQQLAQSYGADAFVEYFCEADNQYLTFLKSKEGYTGNLPALLWMESPSENGYYYFNDITLLPTDNDSVVTHGEVAFCGNYDGESAVKQFYLITPDNRLEKGTEDKPLMGFKSYLTLSDAAAEQLLVAHDPSTGIEQPGITTSRYADVYDLNGRLIQRGADIKAFLQRSNSGVYIINKKKVLVK